MAKSKVRPKFGTKQNFKAKNVVRPILLQGQANEAGLDSRVSHERIN